MNGGDGAGRVLVIPFAPGIGDMVMMEPLLRAVQKGLPGCRITMAAKEYAADLLLDANYDLQTPSYFVTEAPAPLRPFHRLLPQRLIARAIEPAMSIDLGPFERTINLFWAWETRTPFRRWWTPEWPLREGVIHAIDILCIYLESELDVEIPGQERIPRLQPDPGEAEWAERYLEGLRLDGPLATLIPVASDALKWWDARKWAKLNDELVNAGWNTMLVAPSGHPHAEQVYDACGARPTWPDMSLRQLVAMLSRSDLAIGVDTGPLHAASALGVPWVGLFGATNPDLIGPYDRSRGVPVVARFPKVPSCANCWLAFKNRDDRCLTLPATGCATIIPVEEVLEAVEGVASGTLLASGVWRG